MLQDELTEDLRRLAAELDELGAEDMGDPRFGAASDGTKPVPPEIPDFTILSRLGCGGMGAVYVARQVSLDRDVAVKVVSVGDVYREGRASSRPPRPGQSRGLPFGQSPSLPEEARTVAQLHHPNIVQVFSAGGDMETAWFAMELVKGESADRHVFASMEEVTRLGIAVAEALAYAHRCGILHRDVKPSNIFIGDNGMVKLGDFGLACLVSDGVMDKSGTKRYMAPEVLNGGEATEASDQYSFGVTLRELGGPRFVAASSARTKPGPPVRTKPVPPDFAAICAKATAHDPTARYESVEAMLADLRCFLAHEPVAANPPSPLRRFRLFARRNPLAAFGTVTAVFLLAALVIALAVGYVKTTSALEAVHQEAAHAAQSLAATMTNFDRHEADPRDTELRRALEVAEALAVRFPDDETIKASVEAIRNARERRANLPKRPRHPRYRPDRPNAP